jgi:hypothetical protein
LLDPTTAMFGITPEEPHSALVAALDDLAPMARHTLQDPLHQYAAAREATHLWVSGAQDRVVKSLSQRPAVIPAENLARWRSWYDRIAATFGPDHPDTLTTRSTIALWTGQTGNQAEALRLSQELLPDMVRVLGPDRPDILATRSTIALWTGQTGNPAEALRLLQELLSDMVRVLGPDHPHTLTARSNIASWIGEAGNPAEALRLSQELLPDLVRVLGPDHFHTLAVGALIHLVQERTMKRRAD